jgi:hypothetical protein
MAVSHSDAELKRRNSTHFDSGAEKFIWKRVPATSGGGIIK